MSNKVKELTAKDKLNHSVIDTAHLSKQSDSKKKLKSKEAKDTLIKPEEKENQDYLFNLVYNDEEFQKFKLKRCKSDITNQLSHTDYLYQEKKKFIDLSDFDLVSSIGKGAYGRVMLVQRRSTGDYYAMKIVRFSNDVDNDAIQDLINEKNIFDMVGGEHVVKAYFTFSHKNYVIFVMEFMQGGDFSSILTSEGFLDPEVEAPFYAAELVLAIEYLHSINIVHRDLKPQNILLDKGGHLKLADFGLSKAHKKSRQNIQSVDSQDIFRELEEVENMNYKVEIEIQTRRNRRRGINLRRDEAHQAERDRDARPRRQASGDRGIDNHDKDSRVVGTPDYIPPEVLLGQSKPQLAKAVDWWALGCIVYELILGFPPFNAKTQEEVFRNIKTYKRGEGGYEIEWPPVGDEENCLSRDAFEFLNQLLEIDPAKRLGSGPTGAEEIKKHPFFKNIDWATIRKETPPLEPKEFVVPTSKRMDIKLEEIFKEDKNTKQQKGEASIDPHEIELFRVDLLHNDNKLEYELYTKNLDTVRKEKQAIFEKLFEIEKEGFFIV